jgi:hypothetical protein
MRIAFRNIRLSALNKLRLEQINSIIREYQKAGYKLTLRQLYYQLVSRDVIPNQPAEYAKLSKILVEGRMAGVVDWDAIEDRLRTAEKPSSWDEPADIMKSVIHSYAKPRMKGQPNYIEVWVEKDALSGVLSRVTKKYHIPILVNRGYSSVSAIFDSYNRFKDAMEDDQKITILYLGDYDPSGMDMIRDVTERPLEMLLAKWEDFVDKYNEWVDAEHEGDFTDAKDSLQNEYGDIEEHPDCFGYKDKEEDMDDYGCIPFNEYKAWMKSRFEVVPVALTLKQIKQYKPPPNVAKKTDPRAKKFIAEHGSQSWEVDALKPEILNRLLTDAIEERIDMDTYQTVLDEEQADIQKLQDLSDKL